MDVEQSGQEQELDAVQSVAVLGTTQLIAAAAQVGLPADAADK